jgi:hypothetical protein
MPFAWSVRQPSARLTSVCLEGDYNQHASHSLEQHSRQLNWLPSNCPLLSRFHSRNTPGRPVLFRLVSFAATLSLPQPPQLGDATAKRLRGALESLASHHETVAFGYISQRPSGAHPRSTSTFQLVHPDERSVVLEVPQITPGLEGSTGGLTVIGVAKFWYQSVHRLPAERAEPGEGRMDGEGGWN